MKARLPLALPLALLLAILLWRPARADQTVHIVQPGETLFRIGLKYGVPWPAIMQANGLTRTTIYAGQRLVIPLDATAQAPSPEPGPGPTPTAEPPPTDPPTPEPAPANPATYTVQRGDTLSQIARHFGVTVAQLALVNRLTDPSRIYAGQVLSLPDSSPAPAPPPPSGTGKRILVDISEQRLYAYEGEALVFNFLASTGEPGRATVPGSYSVLNKIPNAYASTWNLQMPNWLGIYWAGRLQNGIHALPILSNGQRLWEGYLGTPVSYGCVILGVDDSLALYNWAEVGTPVVIQW